METQIETLIEAIVEESHDLEEEIEIESTEQFKELFERYGEPAFLGVPEKLGEKIITYVRNSSKIPLEKISNKIKIKYEIEEVIMKFFDEYSKYTEEEYNLVVKKLIEMMDIADIYFEDFNKLLKK
jgi:predicted ATP-grasp superfamily ATP-dependent carboligase